jgi:hypothetical protein
MAQHEARSERGGNERERALDARENELDAREAQQAGRQAEVDNVLSKAAQRDRVADARDWHASQRDSAANMEAWSSGKQRPDDATTRQDALDDRLYSKGDRASSAIDRSVLADLVEDDAQQQTGT